MDETGRLIAVMLLASFAIERVAATVDYCLGSKPEKTRKLVRVGVSALMALGVVAFSGIRILGAMKFTSPGSWVIFRVDFLLTWLILVGGADKVGQFIGAGSSGAPSPARKDDVRPIQIFLDNQDVTAQALRSEL